MKFVRKSEAQRRLHKLIGLANLTGETFVIVDRSGSPIAVIISAREFSQGSQEALDPKITEVDSTRLEEL